MLEGWLWLLAAFAVFVAGMSKGGFGSGIGFVSSAILAVVLEPTHALALMLPLLIIMDFSALKPYWKQWDGPSTRVLVIGSVFGCIAGILLFKIISADALRLMIGAIALLFPLFQLARVRGWISPQPRDFSSRDGIIAGIAAGFTSFISHAGGPAVAVFMLSQRNVGKTLYQATTVIVFWAINLMKFASYAYLGLFSWDLMGDVALLAPVAIFGTWVGVKAHHAIPERLFFGITYVALVLTGVKLIYDGLF
ncbi:sulfite exporter TauE/SafE family protein [Roseobacter sp. HKCCD5988]|jgi:uncharacterized membrane protein YfcA|uniref:sulfite exporter TauE/SafE family protein n=1 Tax=Roseobacter sp. HKCCD5988 TaxID=3120338 RepID=UPI0030EE2228